MSQTMMVILAVCGFIAFLLLGVPVAFSLGFIGLSLGLITLGTGVLSKLGNIPYYMLFNLDWIPLPLFILLGSLIAETTMGSDLFNAASKWLSRIPGGLMISGIFGEAVMSAALGTSSSTIIVVGKVAVPEFDKHGYNRSYAIGSLLAGGVLGPLIPPSTTMIIYSVLTETSLGRLFSAGIMPGILCAIMLALPAFLICWRRPKYGAPTGGVPWRERFASLTRIWPVILVILAILGSIYLGVATPNESAGVGVVAVLIIGIAMFDLRWPGIKRAIIEAVTVNAMMMFVFTGAALFSYIVGSGNAGKYVAELVRSSSLSPWWVIIAINILLLILCCPLDEITVTFVTLPIFVPLIVSLGFDPIWFGIVFLVNTQLGLITPPLGMDLFVTSTIFNIPTVELLRGVTPFFIALLVFLAIIIAFPQISLWLPSYMVR